MEPEMILLVTVCVLTAVLSILFVFLIVLYLTSSPYANMSRCESEYYFECATEGKGGNGSVSSVNSEQISCPSLDETASLDLSVIVPAYNEEKRLPKMLDEAIAHLERKSESNGGKWSYEIIVVDDGSSDLTTQTALKYSLQHGTDKVRVLRLRKNRGKGGAVRFGMLSARGRNLLFADADGATRFSDVERLQEEMRRVQRNLGTNLVVICGSRAHLEHDSMAKRSYFRTVLMLGFHMLVATLCVRKVRDTQCGFKLLTRPAAKLLFTNLHVERWAFDVDMLYIAEKFDVAIGEVPVTWHEVDGSKIVPIFSWLQMAKDLLFIRLRYSLGVWKLERKYKVSKTD